MVYDSMWHTTEAMATEITEAFIEMGIPARLLDLKVNHISDIMAEVLDARFIAVGSPTLNKTMMPTVASFLCYMRGLAPAGRASAFPSAATAGRPWAPTRCTQALESCKFTLPEAPLTHQWWKMRGLNALHDAIVDYVRPLPREGLKTGTKGAPDGSPFASWQMRPSSACRSCRNARRRSSTTSPVRGAWIIWPSPM